MGGQENGWVADGWEMKTLHVWGDGCREEEVVIAMFVIAMHLGGISTDIVLAPLTMPTFFALGAS